SSWRLGLTPLAALPHDLLDLLRGTVESIADLGRGFLVPENLGSTAIGCLGDVLDGAVYVHHGVAEEGRPKLGDAVEDIIDGGPVLGEIGAAFVGDRVDLLATFLDGDARVAHVLEQG